MGPTALCLVASIIDRIEGACSDRGHPRSPAEAVLETLRFFLREGVQWRELRASEERVSGSTLRRRLSEWSATALLRQVHAVLVRMVRSGPEAAAAAWDVVVDSCSVRAKHGGDLTGPNPTDRGKPGTKYHVVVSTDGIPLVALPSAANVNDTMLFPGLRRRALVVCVAIARLYADAGYDSAENRWLCVRDGILPVIRRKSGEPHGSGLGAVRCIVEHANAWLLANKRLDRRHDRLASIIDALLTAACIFLIANRLVLVDY
jgi:transposase